MADDGERHPLSYAEKDLEALRKFNRVQAETLQKEKLARQHNDWRGNPLPPFAIEPLPHERQRLFKPMTAEDRMLRKQWLDDQQLAPGEPKYIPELYPTNIFRRIYRLPYDAMTKPMVSKVGVGPAYAFRWVFPKMMGLFLFSFVAVYHLKYHSLDWTSEKGWRVTGARGRTLPGDPLYPEGEHKEYDDFNARGFKERKAMQNLKTSSAGSWASEQSE